MTLDEFSQAGDNFGCIFRSDGKWIQIIGPDPWNIWLGSADGNEEWWTVDDPLTAQAILYHLISEHPLCPRIRWQ